MYVNIHIPDVICMFSTRVIQCYTVFSLFSVILIIMSNICVFAGNTENTRGKQSLREVTKCRYKYFGMFFCMFLTMKSRCFEINLQEYFLPAAIY